MSRRPILRDAFTVLCKDPRILLIEIGWHWSFGLYLAAALALAAAHFFKVVPITQDQTRELSSRVPPLIADAVAHILLAGGPTLLRISIILLIASIVVWTVLATLGQAAVLARLGFSPSPTQGKNLRTSFWLHLWRAIVFVLALVASLVVIAGAGIAGTTFSHNFEPNIAAIAAILFPGLFIVAIVWLVVNWYLSLAVLFVNGSTMQAIRSAFRSSRTLKTDIGQIGLAIALLRLIWILLIMSVSFALAFTFGQNSVAGPLIILILLTLIYFAVADFFYLARLIAYARLVSSNQLSS